MPVTMAIAVVVVASVCVQRRDRLVFLAVLLDAKRLDDAFEFVTILRDVGEQIRLREFVLAVGFHLRRVVDSGEVVREAVVGLRNETLTARGCARPCLAARVPVARTPFFAFNSSCAWATTLASGA